MVVLPAPPDPQQTMTDLPVTRPARPGLSPPVSPVTSATRTRSAGSRRLLDPECVDRGTEGLGEIAQLLRAELGRELVGQRQLRKR